MDHHIGASLVEQEIKGKENNMEANCEEV